MSLTSAKHWCKTFICLFYISINYKWGATFAKNTTSWELQSLVEFTTAHFQQQPLKSKVFYGQEPPRVSQWRIYYHRMWVQLSTTCSNYWSSPIGSFYLQPTTSPQPAMDNSISQSETVDPIDWSHPLPYTGQSPLSSMYCTLQCGLQITRLAALSQPRTCNLRKARPMHCLCCHWGYALNLWSVLSLQSMACGCASCHSCACCSLSLSTQQLCTHCFGKALQEQHIAAHLLKQAILFFNKIVESL